MTNVEYDDKVKAAMGDITDKCFDFIIVGGMWHLKNPKSFSIFFDAFAKKAAHPVGSSRLD